MASREERMQQRLRGAQRRQFKEVDFGLVFPAAVPESRPELPATQDSPEQDVPQPGTLPRLSSRRTPNARQQASNIPTAQESTRSAGSHSTIDANTSAKRRKLDSDNAPISSSRSTRSQPRPDIYTLGDDPQDETVLDMLLDTTNEPTSEVAVAATQVLENVLAPFSIPATRSRVQTPSLLAKTVDEVVESPKDAPGSGHRIRGSGVDVTTSSSRLQIIQEDSTIQTESETPIRQNKRKRAESQPQRSPRRTRRSIENKALQDTSLELDELSPEQPSRITQTSELQEETQMSEDEPAPDELEEAEEAEAIGDEQAAAILRKNKDRRKSRGAPATPTAVELPSSPQAQQRRGRHPDASTPAQQRQPKQGPKKAKPVKINKTVRIGSPIPVTVHRFTNPLVYNEEESDADILNYGIPHTKRAGVNTIDVLSEVCGEIVAAALQTLDDGASACEDAALRREYRTKWQAVAAFGKELQTRLLEHTINLDNGYSLEKRLRVEQKRKIQLRDDILRLRAEREKIALRMDKVRIRHETEKTKAQSQDDLNANVYDIEMAIDLGKQRQNDANDQSTEITGTEVLLRRVAGEVSNNSDSGGILRQIKEFNAFLERAALVLEAKKV